LWKGCAHLKGGQSLSDERSKHQGKRGTRVRKRRYRALSGLLGKFYAYLKTKKSGALSRMLALQQEVLLALRKGGNYTREGGEMSGCAPGYRIAKRCLSGRRENPQRPDKGRRGTFKKPTRAQKEGGLSHE